MATDTKKSAEKTERKSCGCGCKGKKGKE